VLHGCLNLSAAGAALGGGAARRIADACGGDEGQAEVYNQVMFA
jgi:hypothetical protein